MAAQQNRYTIADIQSALSDYHAGITDHMDGELLDFAAEVAPAHRVTQADPEVFPEEHDDLSEHQSQAADQSKMALALAQAESNLIHTLERQRERAYREENDNYADELTEQLIQEGKNAVRRLNHVLEHGEFTVEEGAPMEPWRIDAFADGIGASLDE